MSQYRILVVQRRECYITVEAPNRDAARANAEVIYGNEASGIEEAELDHDVIPVCRDCGDIIDAPTAEGLPGLCGPCSIPEKQDRERGRSKEV